MSNQTLTKNSPFLSRFLGWMNERFPPATAIAFLLVFLLPHLYAQHLIGQEALEIGMPQMLGYLACWFFYLMLRVFDEHKDYELDCQNHPNRVLQRGIITLTDLKKVGALGICIQLSVSLYLDEGIGPITQIWFITIGWSLLMAKEFFIGAWLEKRLLLYAISHMLVIPIAFVWYMTMAAHDAPLPMQPTLWIVTLGFFTSFAGEVSRKIKAPQDERDSIDSYTKVLGLKGAPITLCIFVVLNAFLVFNILELILGTSPGWGWWIALILAVLLGFGTFMKFLSDPNPKWATLCEASSGGATVIFVITLLVALFQTHSVVWFA